MNSYDENIFFYLRDNTQTFSIKACLNAYLSSLPLILELIRCAKL